MRHEHEDEGDRRLRTAAGILIEGLVYSSLLGLVACLSLLLYLRIARTGF